jgi:hypothetical protein
MCRDSLPVIKKHFPRIQGIAMSSNTDPALSDYADADQILGDAKLDDTQKLDLLTKWKSDLESRIEAEAEGMSSSDPMHHRQEANIADQLQAVTNAMIGLGHTSEASLDGV